MQFCSKWFSDYKELPNILRFHFYDRLLPLLYPRHCPVCGSVLPYGSYICEKCAPELPYMREPVCLSCGKPVASSEQEYCYDCRIFPKRFRAGRALFIYNDKTRPAMTAFKYKNRRVLSPFFRPGDLCPPCRNHPSMETGSAGSRSYSQKQETAARI